jgi:hypothetical protein
MLGSEGSVRLKHDDVTLETKALAPHRWSYPLLVGGYLSFGSSSRR